MPLLVPKSGKPPPCLNSEIGLGPRSQIQELPNPGMQGIDPVQGEPNSTSSRTLLSGTCQQELKDGFVWTVALVLSRRCLTYGKSGLSPDDLHDTV